MNISNKFRSHYHDPILALLRQAGRRPLSEAHIAAQLKLRGGARKRLRLLLNSMLQEGAIQRLAPAAYMLGTAADLISGTVEILRSGDGFIAPLNGDPDIFVPRDKLGRALPQDRVLVQLDQRAPSAAPGPRRSGRVMRILERTPKALVGTLQRGGRHYYVVPLNPAYPQYFCVRDPLNARPNDRVVIQFAAWPQQRLQPEAKIIEVIGPATKPSLDTLAIIKQYDLPTKFPPAALREAAALSAASVDERRDLRALFTFTIDPATARDFDDALSLEQDAQGRRVLGVHIADVAHFVRAGGALDAEARQRGNSVYLPDKVLPMLPEELSNGLCSLRPQEDRLAFSVLITFDGQGLPVHTEFCRSLIRSRLRLTYAQALAALQGDPPPDGQLSAQALSSLRQVHRLAQQLRQRRFAQHALDLDMPEYEVIMGRDSMIVDIRQVMNDISHQLIEECMVAANEAVDRHLSSQGLALLRRVHEPPAPHKIEMLTAQLIEMGLQPGDLAQRAVMTAFLKSVRGHPLEYDVKVAVLKSMPRASYAPEPLGHFGLAKRFYAHFTSPIRRYPDLVAHRILAAALTRQPNPYTRQELKMLGRHCSDTEQTAEAAEKALLEIKKYRFLEQQLRRKQPQVYDAVVVRARNFGLFIELTRLQVQGLIHVASIARGSSRFDAQREILRVGETNYAFGTRVRVFITRVDFDKRQLDFALAGRPSAARQSRARAAKGSRRRSS